MADLLIGAALEDVDARLALAITSGACRVAAERHRLGKASSLLLAQAFSAGALLASLLERGSRVNLQLACDGPLRGLFVDAGNDGSLRGYAKNAALELVGHEGPFQWRPALGNRGYLSVLRERADGELYRSSVELEAFELARDLERYFLVSEQVPTFVALASRFEGRLSSAGVLVQPLPGGDRDRVAKLWEAFRAKPFLEILSAAEGDSPESLLHRLVPGAAAKVALAQPLAFCCRCSKERVLKAFATLDPSELEAMLQENGKADATCQFCAESYEVSGDELRALLSARR